MGSPVPSAAQSACLFLREMLAEDATTTHRLILTKIPMTPSAALALGVAVGEDGHVGVMGIINTILARAGLPAVVVVLTPEGVPVDFEVEAVAGAETPVPESLHDNLHTVAESLANIAQACAKAAQGGHQSLHDPGAGGDGGQPEPEGDRRVDSGSRPGIL